MNAAQSVPTILGGGRFPALSLLTDEELMREREVLAEDIGPKWLRLESIDDEMMHRRRERRREQILCPPWTQEERESAPAPSGAVAEVAG